MRITRRAYFSRELNFWRNRLLRLDNHLRVARACLEIRTELVCFTILDDSDCSSSSSGMLSSTRLA